MQVSIVAKGEPLTYQWFRDDAPIEMATQAFLYISQTIQAHNAGRYHCHVSNWQGSVASTVVCISVVDDQTDVDPSQKYRVPHELLRPGDVVSRVHASTGALLHHKSTGVRLLLPPRCFQCVDAHGADVSDSLGLEVVIRTLASGPKTLALRHSDTLVSCMVEILPPTVPAFDWPVTLLLPHCASASDASSELVAVRVDAATGNYEDVHVFSHDAKPSSASGGSSRQVCTEIQTFGAFAVVARSLPSSLDASHALEQATLLFVRPTMLASAAFSKKVVTSLWIARDRPDALEAAAAAIDRHLSLETPLPFMSERMSSVQRLWTIETLEVHVRRGNVVCVQVGERERFAYEWVVQDDAQVDRRSARHDADHASLQSSLLSHDFDCIASAVTLDPSELMETASVPDDPLPSFCALTLAVAVHKRLAYGAKRLNVADFFAKPTALAPSSSSVSASVVLSETQWRVLIPVTHDAPHVPPMPRLVQRSLTHVMLEFDATTQVAPAASASSSSGKTSQHSLLDAHGRVGSRKSRSMDGDDDDEATVDRFAERDEGEREFTPFVYVVEMATFSETFWQRYDQTWWFDKTKTAIINGMYKVVHAGVEPFAVVATDAFAGCFRVAQCSLDRFGGYSEPMLLEPLPTTSGGGDADGAKRSNGLVTKLRSIQRSSSRAATPSPDTTTSTATDCSAAWLASKRRLDALLSTVYASTSLDHFHALVSFPNDSVESVATSLEALRTKCCASNLELTLLLAALQGLDARVRRVRVRASGVGPWIAKLRLVERLVPELDCYPVEFFASVTTELHALVLRCSDVLRKLSDAGWLGQYVLLTIGSTRDLSERMTRH